LLTGSNRGRVGAGSELRGLGLVAREG